LNALHAIAQRAARGLIKHAQIVVPYEQAEWARAMTNELDYLSPDVSAVGWALGCIWVCYVERICAMVRSLDSLPRSILVIEMVVCFLPLTWLFSAVVQRGFNGGIGVPEALLYGSASVLGPLGFAAAVRSIFAKSRAMSRVTTTALCVLTAWTLAAYSSQLLTFGHSHLSEWWQEFVLIAILPALAVLHVVFINSHRRGSLVAA
jgi:hypothetical protein